MKKTILIPGAIILLSLVGFIAFRMWKKSNAKVSINGVDGYIIDDFEEMDYLVIPHPVSGGAWYQSPKDLEQWTPYEHSGGMMNLIRNQFNKAAGAMGKDQILESTNFDELVALAKSRGYIK